MTKRFSLCWDCKRLSQGPKQLVKGKVWQVISPHCTICIMNSKKSSFPDCSIQALLNYSPAESPLANQNTKQTVTWNKGVYCLYWAFLN